MTCVHDAEKAALEVQNYRNAVSWAAQTALRDVIGRTSLSDLLRGREQIEEELDDGSEKATLVTHNRGLQPYGVPVIWT